MYYEVFEKLVQHQRYEDELNQQYLDHVGGTNCINSKGNACAHYAIVADIIAMEEIVSKNPMSDSTNQHTNRSSYPKRQT